MIGKPSRPTPVTRNESAAPVVVRKSNNSSNNNKSSNNKKKRFARPFFLSNRSLAPSLSVVFCEKKNNRRNEKRGRNKQKKRTRHNPRNCDNDDRFLHRSETVDLLPGQGRSANSIVTMPRTMLEITTVVYQKKKA